jgi:glycerophosphoryl diester phosphodiesterase
MHLTFLVLFWLGNQVSVISHRGEHLAHPENTLPAFQAAIDAGADYFELDVRTTSDGRLVLLHDATVDRTTNGSGRVRDLTFDQIRALDAGAKFNPNFTGTKVPSLEEALTLAHGKIGVYVDCKQIDPADLVAALDKADMADKVVIYGGVGLLKRVKTLRPSAHVMPEAENAATVEKLSTDLQPTVIAFDAGDFKDDVISLATRAHIGIFVDRLWAQDNLSDWKDAVTRGAAGIQTDHPAEVVAYLRSQGLHK